MAASVLVLGLLSLGMLLWIDRISQQQRAQFALADTVMDFRIAAATAHLRLEEAIAGLAAGTDSSASDMERAWADLREAVRLSEILVTGGSEDGLVVEPPSDPELRRHAGDLRRLVAEMAAIEYERVRDPASGGEGSALAARCDRVFHELQRSAAAFEEIVERDYGAYYDRSRRIFVGIEMVWSCIVAAASTGLWYRERKRRQAEEALRSANDELETRVAARTSALKESEEELRQLSARLHTAQETERQRIASDLHDDVGHSLLLIRQQLGFVAKAAREDPRAAEEECARLTVFTEQAIEDVRRLSRALGPPVLEDRGLSAALRCLVDHHGATNGHTAVMTSSVGDLDDLIARDAQLVVYRIVQEALTNTWKHAHASRVAFHVERHQERLRFVVEDDGIGFDVAAALARESTGRGLGLETMRERARMLGGSLVVHSEKGNGTRIAVDVAVHDGGRAE